MGNAGWVDWDSISRVILNHPALNVVCVLKKADNSGLGYDASWVQKLQRGVARNLTISHRFFCLIDIEVPGVETVPLEHGWMLYWSKLEMFRPSLFAGPTLYFDIDSMVTGNIDALAGPFDGMVMLTDFYPWFRNSSLLWWDASNPIFGELYARMTKKPMAIMSKHSYKGAADYGDQEFISMSLTELGVPLSEWQKIKPKEWFLEFSFENRSNPVITNPPKNVKVCYCLGEPKFHNLPNVPLVRTNWI